MNLPQIQIRRRLLKQRKFRQLLISLAVVSVFLGLLVVSVEKDQGNIKSIPEGLWWAATTITAVGYGDYVPVTGPGRVIGVALEVVGVVMFGLLIAIISTSMNRSQEEYYWKKLFKRIDEMEVDIKTLRKHTNFVMKDNDQHQEDLNSAASLANKNDQELDLFKTDNTISKLE